MLLKYILSEFQLVSITLNREKAVATFIFYSQFKLQLFASL